RDTWATREPRVQLPPTPGGFRVRNPNPHRRAVDGPVQHNGPPSERLRPVAPSAVRLYLLLEACTSDRRARPRAFEPVIARHVSPVTDCKHPLSLGAARSTVQ